MKQVEFALRLVDVAGGRRDVVTATRQEETESRSEIGETRLCQIKKVRTVTYEESVAKAE